MSVKLNYSAEILNLFGHTTHLHLQRNLVTHHAITMTVWISLN